MGVPFSHLINVNIHNRKIICKNIKKNLKTAKRFGLNNRDESVKMVGNSKHETDRKQTMFEQQNCSKPNTELDRYVCSLTFNYRIGFNTNIKRAQMLNKTKF